MRLRALAAYLVTLASAGCSSHDVTAPAPPADPDEILFQSGHFPYSLRSVHADGTGQRTIFSEIYEIRGAAWSPTRERIVFASNRGAAGFGLWTMDTQGQDLIPLEPNGEHGAFPAWSPSGNRIVFESYRDLNVEIYAMNPDGTEATRLTNEPSLDEFPSWSPDGERIAFQSSRGDPNGYSDIWIMDADGGAPERVTFFGDPDPLSWAAHPAWSPTTDEIAFVGTLGAGLDVYIIGTDGTGLRNLTNEPGSYSGVDWSPDGTRIVFVTSRSGNGDVWSMAPDGTDAVNLTQTPDAQETAPDW